MARGCVGFRYATQPRDRQHGESIMKRMISAVAIVGAMIVAPLPFATGAASAQTATPAAAAQAKTKRPVSAGQQAMHERQKKCGAEWKEAKAAGKIEKGMNWPKYWSACNKRLKAGG